MRSHARMARHPMHPMLVMFPTAMFPLLVLLDVLRAYFHDDTFWTVAFWVAGVGVVTTVAAMIPGIVDLAAIPDESKAHRTALIHFGVGTAILLVFLVGFALRWPVGSAPSHVAWVVALDVLGLILVSAQGWLGGELVYRHHIGVLSDAEGADPVTLKGSEASTRPASRANARRPGAERP